MAASAMFEFGRPSLEVETPRGDAELLRSPCRRQCYLERLGLAEKPELDDCRSTASTESGSTASVESWSTASTESEVLPPMGAHDIRQKFLRKLASNKVWAPQAHGSQKHQTVVIFDWDDTLLPTTSLRRTDFHPGDNDEDDECLRAIVQHAKKALETAIKAGHTYIITNAGTGWVEYSAARWAPELLPVLRKVKVISARDKFKASFPDDIWQWKIHAFLEVQRQLDVTPITNLVALGDADYEMQAARIMGEEFEEALVKTVKFRPDPDLEEHRMQLELVETNLERVIGSVRSMKVCMERGM